MAGSRQALALGYEGMGEAELVAHARDGHQDAFRVIMQRCNQRCSASPAASFARMPKPRTSCRKPNTRAFDNLDGFRGEASQTRQELTVRCYAWEAGGP